MQIPEYFLLRPAGWATADVAAFERLYAEQVEGGTGGRIDYRLGASRWQFLCWLADSKNVVLHGSGNADIVEFEPRRPADNSEFGRQQAVYAASDGIWATFFAVVDRAVATSLVNMSVVVGEAGHETPMYYFSVNRDALLRAPWHPGAVYVLPRTTFVRQPDTAREGVPVRSNQWASRAAVRPLASLPVAPVDFPFLHRVNGHDQPTVAARAAQDPDGFPWRDENRRL
jgi:hypothetical protein